MVPTSGFMGWSVYCKSVTKLRKSGGVGLGRGRGVLVPTFDADHNLPETQMWR